MKKPTTSKAQNKQKSKKKTSTKLTRISFEEQLRMRYWVENELMLLLPKLVKKATSYELSAAIQEHLSIAEQQVICLIHVFDALQERAFGYKAPEMTSLIEETDLLFESNATGYTADAAIVAIWQSILLLEIDSYDKLREDAISLGEVGAVKFLEEAILAEQNAHNVLMQIELSAIYSEEEV